MNIEKDIKLKKYSKKKIICILSIITVVGFLIRINYFSFEVPIIADAIHIFFYAHEITSNQQLPSNYMPFNPGWPIFLSGFFSIVNYENIIEYMQLQKILTVFFSAITIIPIYFLCRRFLSEKLAIIGSVIFTFEPHLIQNSLLGIGDSLYFLLLTISLVLVLNQKKKLVLISFFLVGIAFSVRTEAIFLLFSISTIFLINNRNNKGKIFFISICILVFLIPFSSVSILKYEIGAHSADITRIGSGFSEITSEERGGTIYRANIASENFLKYFGWSLIPIFVILLPLGIFELIKNRNEKFWIFLGIGIFLILPILYAYSIPLKDTRYVYSLFPIFGIALSFLIFGEVPTVLFILGGIIVIGSVFLLHKIR